PGGRRIEAWMVGEVEELGAEVKEIAFRNLELLAYAKVPVEEARSAHYPDAGAAEFPQRLISESVRAGKAGAGRVSRIIDITVGKIAVNRRLADQIRTNRTARVL